jgi:hypothetical protein
MKELNGVPIFDTSMPSQGKKIGGSPPNTSFFPSGLADTSSMRNASKSYTEEKRMHFIRRMLKNVSIPEHKEKDIQIQMYNGQPMMSNPPYGFLPFMLMSERGEVSKEALIKAINWCGDRKKEYEKSGDYFRMWLFAQRQSMLSGILTHLVKFSLA